MEKSHIESPGLHSELLLLRSEAFIVLLVRQAGFIYVDAGSPSGAGDLVSLSGALAHLGESIPELHDALYCPTEIEAVRMRLFASGVQKHFEALRSLFHPDSFRETKELVEKPLRALRLQKWAFSSECG